MSALVASMSQRFPGGPSPWAALRRAASLIGPGYVVAIGYIDPGNWATDIAAGARYGFDLLSVVLAASLAAAFLQSLVVRLTLAAGQDLARLIAERLPRPWALACWVAAELAMVATDLAELLGAAISLKLLFGLPITVGVVAAGALAVLPWLLPAARAAEGLAARLVGVLLVVIVACFAYELVLVRPQAGEILAGLVPTAELARDPEMLYLALGIIGATLMPHNLYLHSALALRRARERRLAPATAQRLLAIDSWAALSVAGLANMVIVIVAARVFAANPVDNAGLEDAYRLIDPVLGAGGAGLVFAIGLLAAGQSAATSASLAGQVVLEGFLRRNLAPWLRAVLTRGATVGLAVMVPAAAPSVGAEALLVASQFVLCLTLPFVLVPLMLLLKDRRLTAPLPVAAPALAGAAVLVSAVVVLNLWLAATSLA